MEVYRRGIVGVLPDNQEVYFKHLCGIIEARDELCSMEITKIPNGYHFRISPSVPMYIEPILGAILDLNKIFGIKLDIGKSIKSSSTINFKIVM